MNPTRLLFLTLFFSTALFAAEAPPVYDDNGDGTVTRTNAREIINPQILESQISGLLNEVAVLNLRITDLQAKLAAIYIQAPAVKRK